MYGKSPLSFVLPTRQTCVQKTDLVDSVAASPHSYFGKIVYVIGTQHAPLGIGFYGFVAA